MSLIPDLTIEQSHSQSLCTEYLPISEATEQQPSTSQENVDIPEVGKVSEHNDSTLEINIPTENYTNTEGYNILFVYSVTKKKKEKITIKNASTS